MSPTQAELKEQDQNILQNFLSVRNTLYTIWETHRLIVKEQEEMKYYNDNDDKSDASSPILASPTSPSEKVSLGRLGSGLFSSIQKDSEQRGITSPITKKPLFTMNDVQEGDISNDIGPPGSLISEDKPWYETGSSEQLPKPVSPLSNYKNASKGSLNYKKRQHIYESIDDVLAELKQNQGASPNYATLHKWTSQLTTSGSTSSSSSGSVGLDKYSSSQVSSRSSDEQDSNTGSISAKPTGNHVNHVSTTVVGNRRQNKANRPNSGAKERKGHSYSVSNGKMSFQDNLPPPLQPIAPTSGNQPLIQCNKKLLFPEVTVPTDPPSTQAQHSRQQSGPETQNSSVEPDPMVRSQSARWVRRQVHQLGSSQLPMVTGPLATKDGYFTPQMTRSAQNVVQQQLSPTARYGEDYNPLGEENSISLNFSNEVLSMFNFQQQPSYPSPTTDKHVLRTASSSSASTHGRRSVPLKPSPSPDLCVNPLGGPRISPPLDDSQPSTFCHVPRRQSGNINVPPYKNVSNTGDVKLNTKRSISNGSQNNLLNDLPPDYHPGPSLQHRNNSFPSFQNNSPIAIRRDSSDTTKRDIVDCTSSPRFPRRSLALLPGQTVFKGANPQITQPRVAKFTAPPPPSVAPPKLLQQYSSEFRPPISGHVRQPNKVEQTWC